MSNKLKEIKQKVIEIIKNIDNNKEQIKSDMLVNDDFFNWLDSFLEIHQMIWIEKVLNNVTDYAKDEELKDLTNVLKLKILYEIIIEYADKNYFYPNKHNDNGFHFYFSFKDDVYEFGYLSGDVDNLYVGKTTKGSKIDCISIELLHSGKQSPRTKNINEKLSSLTLLVQQLREMSVPEEAIEGRLKELTKKK